MLVLLFNAMNLTNGGSYNYADQLVGKIKAGDEVQYSVVYKTLNVNEASILRKGFNRTNLTCPTPMEMPY